MTDRPEELKARATRAFERSIDPVLGKYHGPIHPDDRALMERAMLSLSRTTREIFLTHRRDGYGYDYIARMTGLSRPQVERRIRTAIHRIARYRRGDERPEWQLWLQKYLLRWFR